MGWTKNTRGTILCSIFAGASYVILGFAALEDQPPDGFGIDVADGYPAQLPALLTHLTDVIGNRDLLPAWQLLTIDLPRTQAALMSPSRDKEMFPFLHGRISSLAQGGELVG